MADTDTELIALLAKLRTLQESYDQVAAHQARLKEELDATKAKADELRRKAKERRAE